MADGVEMVGKADYTDLEAGLGGVPVPTTANLLPPERKGFLKPIPETTPIERVAGVCAMAAFGTALAAMIVEQSYIVIAGGILSIVVGGYAYVQQTTLTDIRTLKETKRALQEEVNRLELSNTRLGKSIDDMTATVSKLEDVEEALTILTAAQGQSVDVFKQQVLESKALLTSMESNHKANVLQNLLTLIFRSDKDGDSTISASEADDLLASIRNTSGSSVKIHEDRFRLAVVGKPVGAVISVVENLVKDDVPAENRIFEIAPQ
jgi:hypothetical protein